VHDIGAEGPLGKYIHSTEASEHGQCLRGAVVSEVVVGGATTLFPRTRL
jgi:hypothetical protein